jgi:hypothetical protein
MWKERRNHYIMISKQHDESVLVNKEPIFFHQTNLNTYSYLKVFKSRYTATCGLLTIGGNMWLLAYFYVYRYFGQKNI